MNQKKALWINLIIVLALIAIVMIRSIRGGGSDVDFALSEDRLSISGPGEFTVSVEFSDVSSIAFRDSLDQGVCIDGGSEGSYTYGIWENEEFGQYALHVLTKVNAYIVLTEVDGDVIVFNIESDKTTEAFSESLTKHLQEMGYSVP